MSDSKYFPLCIGNYYGKLTIVFEDGKNFLELDNYCSTKRCEISLELAEMMKEELTEEYTQR